MYRIKAKKGDSWIPILCSPEIIATSDDEEKYITIKTRTRRLFGRKWKRLLDKIGRLFSWKMQQETS